MNRKHNPRQAFESRIRSAVERQTPDLKGKIMAELKDHEEISAAPAAARRHPAWKYAVSFAAVALVAGGMLVVPKAIQPAGTAPRSSSAQSTVTQTPQNPFVLTAYAAEKGAVSSGNGKASGLTLMRPISVSGIDCSDFERNFPGRSVYDTMELLKDDGTNQLWAKYLGFNLKCVGEHIKSVTFTADRGGFAQIKNLTQAEYNKIHNSIPYVVERNKEESQGKSSGSTSVTPNPGYGDGKSMELASGGWSGKGEDGKQHEEIDGFLPVGNSYTVSYAEQDDYRIQYALRLTMTYAKKDVEENWDMKEPNHRASKALAGTVVTITATYEDGHTASRQCVLRLDPDTWIFTVVEKPN